MSDQRPHDHERRMRAAEARAGWELGSRSWAGVILAAYWNPDEDGEALEREQGRYDEKEARLS